MGSILKLITWPLCLLFSLSLYVGNSSQVLCIGDQGHVKIEPAHLQTCCETERSIPVAVLEVDADPLHDCVGCSDVPLGSSQWRQRSKVTNRPIIRSFTITQVCPFDDRGTVFDGNSGCTWAIITDRILAVPIAMAPTVLRC